jgi:membrane protein DedA with SNARE-associated domain
MPIIAAAVLTHEGFARWWVALPVCIAGVLAGDVVLYWVGRHWGESIVQWRIVRSVLNRQREERLKAAYRRHAVKTVVVARPIIGLRAATFLTAGIAGVPFGRFVAADCGAALVGVTVIFWLAYLFTDQLTGHWPMSAAWNAGWRWWRWWLAQWRSSWRPDGGADVWRVNSPMQPRSIRFLSRRSASPYNEPSSCRFG